VSGALGKLVWQAEMKIGGTKVSHYPLSFTAGALLIEESREVAAALLTTSNISEAKAQIKSSGALQSRTESAGRRILAELIFRLGHLSPEELELVAHGEAEAARQFLWIVNCLRYPLIREFAEGPLADARANHGATVSSNEIEAFIWSRSQAQPQLAETSPSTRAKLRQVLGLMTLQAGLVNSNKELLRGALSPELTGIFEAHPHALNWTGGLKLL
jgi:hypothetical protein